MHPSEGSQCCQYQTVCQLNLLDAYLTVSAMHDVDIPSHVVGIERGTENEGIGSTFFLSSRFATPFVQVKNVIT